MSVFDVQLLSSCKISSENVVHKPDFRLEFLSATLGQVPSSGTGNSQQISVKTSSQYKYIIAIVSVVFVICVLVVAFICFVVKRRRSGDTCADTSPPQGTLNIFGIRSARHQRNHHKE